jgi:hypothetical protein
VQLHTHPEKPAQTTPAPAPGSRHNYECNWLTRMLCSCWLTTGVSLTYHWKNDCNHEALNFWRGPRPCYLLSIRVSATREHNYKPVIKTFAVSSQEQQWPPRTTQQPSHTLDMRQRFQSARTQIATISSDIRQYFPGIADSAT